MATQEKKTLALTLCRCSPHNSSRKNPHPHPPSPLFHLRKNPHSSSRKPRSVSRQSSGYAFFLAWQLPRSTNSNASVIAALTTESNLEVQSSMPLLPSLGCCFPGSNQVLADKSNKEEIMWRDGLHSAEHVLEGKYDATINEQRATVAADPNARKSSYKSVFTSQGNKRCS